MHMIPSVKRKGSDIDFLMRIARLQIESGDSKAWVPSTAIRSLVARGATVTSRMIQETGTLVHLRFEGLVLVTVVPTDAIAH